MSTADSLHVVSPDEGLPSGEYYGYSDTSYSVAPANLSYTVQQAIDFGNPPILGEDPFELRLASGGCLHHDGTGNVVYNCSISCMQPSLIFNDTATMANCMAYGLISDSLAGNVSDSFKRIAMTYGISENRTTAANVNSTMQSCFRAYCQASKPCADYNAGSFYYFSDANTGNLTLYDDGLVICEGVVAPALTDIAGIGVLPRPSLIKQRTDDFDQIYISYWLQSGIALTAFSLLKLYDFWIYYLFITTFIWRRGYVRARSAAQLVREKAKERALPRLAAALVEFQKAQCYFMLAVQIAAMATISQGQLQASSLQQLYNNWEVVHVISISGFLPVTFILFCLQSVGKRSWYLTVLSAITVGVSAATLFMTGSFSPSAKDMAYVAEQPSTIAECGYHDPTLYCLNRYMDDTALGSDSAIIILVYSLIILVYLIVDLLDVPGSIFYHRCRAWLERSKAFAIFTPPIARTLFATGQSLDLIHTRLEARKESWNPSTPQWILMLRNALAACVSQTRNNWRQILAYLLYTTIWGLYIFFFSELMAYFSLFISGGMVNSTWGFGQIVGITVWAEPLVEYAYLELSTFPLTFAKSVK